MKLNRLTTVARISTRRHSLLYNSHLSKPSVRNIRPPHTAPSNCTGIAQPSSFHSTSTTPSHIYSFRLESPSIPVVANKHHRTFSTTSVANKSTNQTKTMSQLPKSDDEVGVTLSSAFVRRCCHCFVFVQIGCCLLRNLCTCRCTDRCLTL
jgi:hypothetical protein